MTLQLGIVLVLVAFAALYFGRGFILGLLGKGGCESGGSCASCGTGGCTVAKLEELRKQLEASKPS
jgi:hypothetical protein